MPSVKTYVKLYGTLCLLTGVTVGVYYLDLGSASLLVALAVAIVKASLVAAIFMHLWYDHHFYMLLVGTTFVVLIFFFAFTFIEMGSRGSVNPESGPRIEAATPGP